MLEWVISNIEGAGIDRICVVTGYRAEMVDEYLGGRYETAYQAEQLGTGHAVMQAREFLEKCRGDVLVPQRRRPVCRQRYHQGIHSHTTATVQTPPR